MRLSKDIIREIVVAHKSGEGRSAIANRFNIHPSTVTYHVEQYAMSSYFGSGIYSVIRAEVQHECIHPSMVCTCCGKRTDTILREERVKIKELEGKLDRGGIT